MQVLLLPLTISCLVCNIFAWSLGNHSRRWIPVLLKWWALLQLLFRPVQQFPSSEGHASGHDACLLGAIHVIFRLVLVGVFPSSSFHLRCLCYFVSHESVCLWVSLSLLPFAVPQRMSCGHVVSRHVSAHLHRDFRLSLMGFLHFLLSQHFCLFYGLGWRVSVQWETQPSRESTGTRFVRRGYSSGELGALLDGNIVLCPCSLSPLALSTRRTQVVVRRLLFLTNLSFPSFICIPPPPYLVLLSPTPPFPSISYSLVPCCGGVQVVHQPGSAWRVPDLVHLHAKCTLQRGCAPVHCTPRNPFSRHVLHPLVDRHSVHCGGGCQGA